MAENNKQNVSYSNNGRFTSAKNPWLGLSGYNEGQKLYGRDKETAELTNIILCHTATVVYGKSGIGKSSLLKAGVFPHLRSQNYIPIYLRLEHNTKVSYVKQIENAISENIKSKDLLDKKAPDLGLWDFFHRNRFIDENNNTVVPVVVLDQFEEIFTLTQVAYKSDVEELFAELADILNDVKPDKVLEAENCNNKNDISLESDTNRSGFILRPLSKSSFKYVKSPAFRIIISLRDDSLFLLERKSAKIPAIKTNRYNLCALDENSALDVILKPSPGLFNIDDGKNILQDLAYYEYDDYRVVDPAILSLYLFSYYQEQGTLTYADIFASYYNKNTTDIKDSSILYIEDHLLTERGNRNQIPKSELLASVVTEGELELLLQRKILKIEKRKNTEYVEFSHDRLCEQALKHREDRIVKVSNRKMFYRFLVLGLIAVVVLTITLPFLKMRHRYLSLQNTVDTQLDSLQKITYYQSSLYQSFLSNIAQHKDYIWNTDRLGDFIEGIASHQGGQTSRKILLTKIGTIAEGMSTKYTFASKGHQGIAVFAEQDGLISLKINITNRGGLNIHYYNQQEDIKEGRQQRIVSFDLPLDRRNLVELEVINCSKKNISFMMICN